MEEKKHSKTAWALLILLLVSIGIGIIYFLFFLKPTPGQNIPGTDTCLVYQDNDPLKPCYRAAVLPPPPVTSSTTTPQTPLITATTTLSVSEDSLISSCDSPISVEKDDCIKKVAVEEKKVTLCSAISNGFAQNQCVQTILKGEEKSANIFQQAVKSYDFTPVTPVSIIVPTTTTSAWDTSASAIVNKTISDSITNATDALKNPDSRQTLAGFTDRVQNLETFSLFGFSEYQVMPGSTLTAQGIGFAKTNNTVHFGGYEVAGITSTDGVTMTVPLPSNIALGTYEVWVTNEKGTSRKNGQPIQIIVTNTPAPRPSITSVSPANPTINDTVTLSGSNLSGTLAVFTSLGKPKSFQSTPTSITFALSDLEVMAQVKDVASIKGKKVDISVVAATAQGYNKDIFTFPVQF